MWQLEGSEREGEEGGRGGEEAIWRREKGGREESEEATGRVGEVRGKGRAK